MFPANHEIATSPNRQILQWLNDPMTNVLGFHCSKNALMLS
jgi:hypothetical protein